MSTSWKDKIIAIKEEQQEIIEEPIIVERINAPEKIKHENDFEHLDIIDKIKPEIDNLAKALTHELKGKVDDIHSIRTMLTTAIKNKIIHILR